MVFSLIVPTLAESYTIEFKSNTSDATSDLTDKNFAAQIESGAQYVEFKECSKCYQGKNGLKFSSSKVNGSLTLTLTPDAQVAPSSIVLKAVKYGSDTSKVSVNGADAQALDGTELSDYTFDFNTTEPITELVINATKRIYLKSITVNYSSASSDLKPADLSFGEQTTFSVDFGQKFTAPALINPNGLAVSYSSDNEQVAAVDAATGAVTIKSFGSAKITAESAETSEFKAGKASYTLTVVAVANTIAEIYELGADTKTVVKVNFPLVVTYRNKSNCYVRNEANGEVSLIFGDTNYQRGDVIPAGWTCTYSPFNGLPELKPAVGMPETDGTSTVSFDTKTLAEINDLKYANGIYYVRDVTFADATKVSTNDSNERNFTGEQNEVDYNFRANFFGVPSVEAGTYNVLVAVAYFIPKTGEPYVQFYPIEYDQKQDAVVEFGDVKVTAGEEKTELTSVTVSEGITIGDLTFVYVDSNYNIVELPNRPDVVEEDGKWYIIPNKTCGVFQVLVKFPGNDLYFPLAKSDDFQIEVFPNIDYVTPTINGNAVLFDGPNEVKDESAEFAFEAPDNYTVLYRNLEEVTADVSEPVFVEYVNGTNIEIKGNGKIEYKAKSANRESEVKTVTYSISTAVEMIEAADGNAEIYTLDGVRVNSENIETGLYILVRDGKATKIRVVK